MGRYLDPKNDLLFKRVFGEHPDLLISFLNAVMPFEKKQYIKSLEYLLPELVPSNPMKKNSIVDVRCKDNYERQFIVEMQMCWSKSFSNRMVFNASKAYVRQLDIREEYDFLHPVYGLGIIDDVFDNKTDEYYHHYKSINCTNSDEIIEGLKYVMIELPKFKPSTMTEKKMTILWLRFLNEVEENKNTVPQDLLANKYIRKAIELCEEGALTPAELYEYDKYWDIVRTEKSALKDATTKGEEKGHKKGLVEGLEKGRKEGLAEGIEKIVVNSFKNNLSIEVISLATQLSQNEIISILQKHQLYL
jgi:predicted transposase/invertase (TIGR01784 family)